MRKGRSMRKSFGRLLFRAVCILLMLTSLSAWSVSGLYAKYVTSKDMSDAAQVARVGVTTFELKEHEAEVDQTSTGDTLYKLDKGKEVTQNIYSKVLPGVNIPKDPFIKLEMDSEVTYELYLKVTRSEGFPSTVTYTLQESWEPVAGNSSTRKDAEGEFRYVVNKSLTDAAKYHFAPGEHQFIDDTVIQILEDNMLYVSQAFGGTGTTITTFGLTFEAYLQQVINV